MARFMYQMKVDSLQLLKTGKYSKPFRGERRETI